MRKPKILKNEKFRKWQKDDEEIGKTKILKNSENKKIKKMGTNWKQKNKESQTIERIMKKPKK